MLSIKSPSRQSRSDFYVPSPQHVRVHGTGLQRVVDLFDHAGYITVTAESRLGEGLGTHFPAACPMTFPSLDGPVDWCVKKAASHQTHAPPPGLMEILAPHAFSWFEGKRTTLIRFDNDQGETRCAMSRHDDAEASSKLDIRNSR